MPSTPGTLAFKVRAKYPGAYDDLDDAALESAVTAKHPGVYDDIPRSTLPTRPVSAEDFTTKQPDVSVGNVLANAVKSLNPLPAIKAAYADQRPEDVALGPAAVLAPFVRAAASGAKAEAGKAAADVGRGRYSEAAGHALATALPVVGPAAAAAGEDIGSGETERIERGAGNALGLVGSMVAPRVAAAAAPKVAPALATIGEQLASKGKAVAPVLKEAAKTAIIEGAAHAVGAPPLVGSALRFILREALSKGKKVAPEIELPPVSENAGIFPLKPVNAGGQLVRDATGKPIKFPNVSGEVSNALEELRVGAPRSAAAETPMRRSTDLPPDRTGHFTLPKPKAMLNDAQIEDFLTRHGGTGPAAPVVEPVAVAPPPARVTTPPQPSLPPGYKPRTTVPKPKAAKAKLPKAVQAEIEKAVDKPKRAYFLKPVEELADVADDAVTPSGSITPEDLPASWKQHTGQDIFPTTGAVGKELANALKAELKAQGVSVGEAMARVSKNKSIPTRERSQLIRALNQAYTVR